MNSPYDDIIDLPHHISGKHPQMPMYNRAAQFAPFAALTGYDSPIMEAARPTDSEVKLASGEEDNLNRKLSYLLQHIKSNIPLEIVYFEPDHKKDGGSYPTKTGFINDFDLTEGILKMDDGTQLQIRHIKDIKGDFFREYD